MTPHPNTTLGDIYVEHIPTDFRHRPLWVDQKTRRTSTPSIALEVHRPLRTGFQGVDSSTRRRRNATQRRSTYPSSIFRRISVTGSSALIRILAPAPTNRYSQGTLGADQGEDNVLTTNLQKRRATPSSKPQTMQARCWTPTATSSRSGTLS